MRQFSATKFCWSKEIGEHRARRSIAYFVYFYHPDMFPENTRQSARHGFVTNP
jgi:hypothetical protein